MGASIFHGVDFTLHAKKADIDSLDLYAEATVIGDPIRFCDSLVCQWRAFVRSASPSHGELGKTCNAFSGARRLSLSPPAERYGLQR